MSYTVRLWHLVLLVGIIILRFNAPPMAHALEDLQKITISPSVEIKLQPGKSVSGKVPLINQGSTPLTFTLKVQDITVDNNKGIPKIVTSPQTQTISQWIELSQSEVTLQPGERTEVGYYIELPPNILPGGYYASILYESGDTTTKANTQVKTQLGTLLYVTVDGDFLEDAFLKSFTLPSFQEYGPVHPSFEIQNAGTIHIRPRGDIRVDSPFSDTRIIHLTERNIFPGSALQHEYSFGTKHMIGLYTLTLDATYGTHSTQKIQYQRTVLIFPWKLALLILFGLNTVAFIIAGIRHQTKSKIPEKLPDGRLPNHFPTPQS